MMQTFRAYVQDDAGAITWASWIEAAHLEEAEQKAQGLCREGTPTIDLWSAADRRRGLDWELDPL